jgi:hypothetical protein
MKWQKWKFAATRKDKVLLRINLCETQQTSRIPVKVDEKIYQQLL